MLNEIVRRLNGHGEDPQSLEEALKLLAGETAAARLALKELHERRRQALLDDASDSALDKLEREIARGTTRIEKLTIAEPSLRARLSAAQAAARERAIDAALSEYLQLYADARDKLTAVDAAFAVLSLQWDKQEHLLRGLIEPFAFGGLLGRGFGFQWAKENDRVVAAARAARERRNRPRPVIAAASEKPVSAQSISVPTRLPHERARLTDSQRQVSLALSALPIQREPRPADDLTPLEPGEARVKVLRSGFSPAEDRPQAHYGQITRMPGGAAERAANSGAVEVLEVYGEPPATKPTAPAQERAP